jgi:alkanesulfonate monooxygenase SsuD/methylene tetrahydromethanopterin reductase-like flavin-dependent oxidoreductase (luciferase family)
MAATLDHMSHGRLNLGLGAGWFEKEHAAFGIDFMTVPERLRALDEALTIIRGMFAAEKTTLHGRHYRVTDAMGFPKPVQRPHPPIMIGGGGEKVLLRLVAKHADMWNMSGPAEVMARKIDVIRRHADAAGRDAERIEKTVMLPLCYKAPEREQFVQRLVASMRQTTPEEARKQIMIGQPQECFDTIERYRRAGITHFIFMTFTPYQLDELQAFAEEVVPAIRGR